MELYLVRHGQSANNLRQQALAGHGATLSATAEPRMADPPLTDLGKQQARLAGESLRGEGITRLYCGPMLRTLQTARIIGALLDLSPHVFVGLHEWGGVWETRADGDSVQLTGLSRTEMGAMFPGFALPAEVTDRGWWFHDYEGDGPMLELAHRNALSFIAHLEEELVNSDHRIAAILHGGSGSSLVSALFGIPPHAKWYPRFTHDNAGISRISISPDRRQLRYLNRTDHLSNTDARSKPPR